jgi:hypothetical protein
MACSTRRRNEDDNEHFVDNDFGDEEDEDYEEDLEDDKHKNNH